MNQSLIDAAREVDAYCYRNRHFLDKPAYAFSSEKLEAFAAIIRKQERERCAVKAWTHYMETCKKHGHGADVPSLRDFCSAAAIRAMED